MRGGAAKTSKNTSTRSPSQSMVARVDSPSASRASLSAEMRLVCGVASPATTVATACPYCMIMLDDAVRANAKEDDVRVMDLSQLLEESMGEPVAVGAGAPAVAEPVSAEEPSGEE